MKMEKELEVEYKSLITKEKYLELLSIIPSFAKKEGTYTQVNYFFDTHDGILDKMGVTLRIRKKLGKWQLTAKVKVNQGKAEYSSNQEINEFISQEKAHDYLRNGLDSDEKVLREMAKLIGLSGNDTFTCLGSLETMRTDFSFYSDTISLDSNTYNGVTDFELEWESENHLFVSFLNKNLLHIEFGNGKGKRKRFLKSLKK